MSMDVVFPVMPFADVGRPSMGVSLLAAEAQKAGYSTKVMYFNLGLAGTMGLEPYQRVATSYPPNLLIGEWFFADDIFGADIPDAQTYLSEIFIPMAGPDEALIRTIVDARGWRSEYLDTCVTQIKAQAPRIVGFTTTFHQTCACLAVARRLKALKDPPIIVFGGANCEGEMGLQMIQSFSWIDYICCGESDISFVRLLDQLLGGNSSTPLVGVLQKERATAVVQSAPVMDMNTLPYPDFDGYFSDLAASKLAGLFDAHLVLETSRGCWWGAKHHCTFCGLNGDTMVFRSKTPERAYEEIEFLARRHNSSHIGFVDNILDMKYVNTLFPKLAAADFSLDIFYEVKANLRYEQLKQMREGGLTQIQPGIENFSDQVLKLMEKGCTGFQNIQLLRWSKELGIEVAWNILAGFPGESPNEYADIARLLPKLVHLDPPCSCGMVRLDRFSPFHSRAEEFGFKKIRPARAYFYVFPFGRRVLNRLAYFFDFDYQDGRTPQDYVAPVQQEVQAWLGARVGNAETYPRLDADFNGPNLTIIDTRPCATKPRHVFDSAAAALYSRCDVATKIGTLVKEFGQPPSEVEAILSDFESRNIMVHSDDQYLSLAVFRTRPAPNPKALARDNNAAILETTGS
jgi:ribosomal peptide maturation radical SAM protein 1